MVELGVEDVTCVVEDAEVRVDELKVVELEDVEAELVVLVVVTAGAWTLITKGVVEARETWAKPDCRPKVAEMDDCMVKLLSVKWSWTSALPFLSVT
jgi:hypothetical protein